VFNLYHSDRIKAWKEFRDQLEVSQNPHQDVAEFWALAPFVNSYLDPQNPSSWPDPWKLILEGRYDNLAIVLGMLYTLKLTTRFMDTPYEIHMSMPADEKDRNFFLVMDHSDVLNFEYRRSLKLNDIVEIKSKILCNGITLP